MSPRVARVYFRAPFVIPMNKTGLLIAWNVALTALVVWALVKRPAGGTPDPVAEVIADTSTVVVMDMPMDTNALKDAHIAFFFMDSIQSRYELVKESASRVENEGRRLEGNLMNEMKKGKARYEELMKKDHTYSTQAELDADREELQRLEMSIQQTQAEGQEQIDRLQIKMLQDITERVQNFLEEYNRTAGFDFIFSIQDGGQVWVGNKGLDITQAVVNGLNERHRAEKAAPKAEKK